MKKHGYNKKVLSVILAILFVFLYSNQGVSYAQFETISESAILMEASTGRILFEKNANEAMPPASITKIMTLLLAFEALERGDVEWDELVTVSEAAWRAGQGNVSTMFLELGREVEFGEIIRGISIISANDGCVAIADHLYGSEDAFVRIMNQRAQELGLTKTQFQNSAGMPADGHYMSARDIAVLAQYLITTYPRILEIESEKEFTYDPKFKPQKNRNPLIEFNFPGADGLKTGWTTEAGYCLVGTAKQDDMRLISVVLRTESIDERKTATTELLNYGFRNFEVYTLFEANEEIDRVDVLKGKDLVVPVRATSDLNVVVPLADREKLKIIINKDEESLVAPIESGTIVGSVEIRLGDEVLATAELMTNEDVEKAGFFELLLRSIVNFFRSLFNTSNE